jgi:hypothetical protein
MQASSASILAKRRYDHPWLRAAVWALDARLRHRNGVSEYTRRQDCLFRMQIAALARDLRLADGTRLRRGDRILDLHVWNEQFPRMAAPGPTLGWGGRVKRGIDLSLRELARHLAVRPDLDDVHAVRACLSADMAGPSARLARFMMRYGFEATEAQISPLAERMHQIGQNILIAAMVLASNPAAFRAHSLWRGRTEMYLSRRFLEEHYGSGSRPGGSCVGETGTMTPLVKSDLVIPDENRAGA